jgi:hypothetical protein
MIMPATASGISDRQHLFLTYCTTKLATAAGLTEKSTDSLRDSPGYWVTAHHCQQLELSHFVFAITLQFNNKITTNIKIWNWIFTCKKATKTKKSITGCMISVIILIRQFRYCYRLTTEGVWYRSSFRSDSSDTVIDLQHRVYDIGHHSDPTVPILL